MDMSADGPLILGLVVAFAAAVFLAAAETSLLRISPVRAATLATSGRRGASNLGRLLQDLPRVLAAILLAALLAQIAAATITGILAERWFGSLGVTIASIVLTLVLFVYGEAIPKTYAVRHADSVALALAPWISGLEFILRPVVAVLVWFADLQAPGKGVATGPTVTESELKLLATSAAREGEITEHDRVLIERAFRFGDREVDDIMVPRIDVTAIDASATLETALEVALAAGHRRIPVYADDPDNLVGVVRLRDLAAASIDSQATEPVSVLATEPLAVPKSKRIVELLSDMQRTGTHLAVVVDEYGSTAGIVTVEDIAEELLGSIRQDPETAPIVDASDGTWSVDGVLPVEDLADLLHEELPPGEWNTVAGLLMGLSGRVPRLDDTVEIPGHRLKVTGLRGRRITRVAVEPD